MQEERCAVTRGIIIDVGHGGLDSGYRIHEELEKDIMLEVSKYMYDRFKEMKIPVKIVRSEDETLNMKKRFKKIQSSFDTTEDTILISNHLNQDLNNEKMKIIYSMRNDDLLSSKISDNLKKIGQDVSIEQKFLPSNPKKDFYEVLRYKGMNSIRIEFNCKKDRQAKKDYFSEAEQIIKAITDYANLPYEERKDRKASVSPTKEEKNDKKESFNTTKVERNNQDKTYIVQYGDTIFMRYNNH